jgi:hypothetical protein
VANEYANGSLSVLMNNGAGCIPRRSTTWSALCLRRSLRPIWTAVGIRIWRCSSTAAELSATARIRATSRRVPPGDGVIDVFDVIEIIGIAFSGSPDIWDLQCPKTRGDVDNNSVADVFDVIYLIATAFSGGANPINPCGPVAS